MPPIRVLFICAGNICRSPLAEGVFRHHVALAGLAGQFVIDSCGTGGWHTGEPPDRRMRQTARQHGVSLDDLRARQFHPADFAAFDYLLVMDTENLYDLHTLDRHQQYRHKVQRFRTFDPQPDTGDVPDPYYGSLDGFEHVWQIVDRTAQALLNHLIRTHRLAG
jgi:protein-tyrosine phosphatase